MNLYDEMYKLATERRAAKQYNYEKIIDNKTMKKIYSFAKTSPSSMGLELVRIISINRDSKHRKEINGLFSDFNQERAYMASNIALLVTKKAEFFQLENKKFVDRSIRNTKFVLEAKGEEFVNGMEQGYAQAAMNGDHANNGHNIEEWQARQAYIQLPYLLLAAKSLGIDTTPMEGFSSELSEYLTKEGIINNDERVTLAVAFGMVDETTKHPFVGKKQLRESDDEYVKYI